MLDTHRLTRASAPRDALTFVDGAAGAVVTLPSLPRRMTSDERSTLVLLIPVFNDWSAVAQLLPRLDAVCGAHGIRARVLLVDDGSTALPGDALDGVHPASIERVEILHLRRNLGHQRAIAIGLTYIEQRIPSDAVVVMDGDGEDDPADVPRLLERMREEEGHAVVFAGRQKRSEGFGFRVGYAAYRVLHRLVTGIGVNVGNFSAVPRPLLRRLVVVSELWNHYAAAVFRSRIPYTAVPTVRAERLAGKPTMRFVSLVVHGLSALAVHGELVGVRLLVATLMAIGVVSTLWLVGLGVRVFTDLAIPAWASTTGGLSLVLLVQFIMLAAIFTLVALSGRANANFIPLRDYLFFVDGEECVYPVAAAPVRAGHETPRDRVSGDRARV